MKFLRILLLPLLSVLLVIENQALGKLYSSYLGASSIEKCSKKIHARVTDLANQGGTGTKGGIKPGKLKITAKAASVSEKWAAEYMKNRGHKVELTDAVGTRAGGKTSDLVVDGKNYNVYTPKSENLNRIISEAAKKNSQAEGLVIDLSNTDVRVEQLGDVLKRVRGAGATNIKDIIIISK